MKRLCAGPHSYWWWQHRHSPHPRAGNSPQANPAPLTAWVRESSLQSNQTFPMWFHRAWTPKSCQEKGSGGSRCPSSQQWVLEARRAKHTLGSNGAGSWEKVILQPWGQLPQRPVLKQKGKWLGKMLLIVCVARKVCVPWVGDATSSARQALLQKQMQTELSVL